MASPFHAPRVGPQGLGCSSGALSLHCNRRLAGTCARLSLKRKRNLQLLLQYQDVSMSHDLYKSVCAVLAPAIRTDVHPGNTHTFRSSARCAALASVMRAGDM